MKLVDKSPAKDPDLVQFQDRVRAAVNPVLANPIVDGLLVSATIPAGSQTWITPMLINGWVPFGAPFETPGYRIDETGRVYVRGLATGGLVPGTLFVLPVGYRPVESLITATSSNNAHGTIVANAGGNFDCNSGSIAWFSMACSFMAASPADPTPVSHVDVAHKLGRVPIGAWVVNQSHAAHVWVDVAASPLPDKLLRLNTTSTQAVDVTVYVF